MTVTEHKVQPDGITTFDDEAVEQNNVGKDFTRSSKQRDTKVGYTYCWNGQKESVSSQVASAGSPDPERTTGYSYDLRGQRQTVTTPKGSIVYAYDDTARTMTVTLPPPTGAVTQYHYNEQARVSRITHTFADGAATTISYDYDRNGNPTKITDDDPSDVRNEETHLAQVDSGEETCIPSPSLIIQATSHALADRYIHRGPSAFDDGAGLFRAAIPILLDEPPYVLVLNDFDKDGDVDVAVHTDSGNDHLRIRWNRRIQ